MSRGLDPTNIAAVADEEPSIAAHGVAAVGPVADGRRLRGCQRVLHEVGALEAQLGHLGRATTLRRWRITRALWPPLGRESASVVAGPTLSEVGSDGRTSSRRRRTWR